MKAKTTAGVAAIALGALALVVVVFIRAAAIEAVYPIERAHRTFADKVWSRVSGLFNGAEARAENVRLRREVASLEMVRLDNEQLEAENARLRRALVYQNRHQGRWLAVQVLSHGGGAAGVGRTLRVGKGLLAGVRLGAIVVVPEGLVGRVTGVTPHTAEVTRLGDPGMKVACEIEMPGGKGPRGILFGGDETYIMRHLTNVCDVPPRARVLTSGLGGVFPRGIEVGTLISFKEDDAGHVYAADVLPSVDDSLLKDLFIRCEE